MLRYDMSLHATYAVSAGSQSAGRVSGQLEKQVDFGKEPFRITPMVIFRPYSHGPVFLNIRGPEYETR